MRRRKWRGVIAKTWKGETSTFPEFADMIKEEVERKKRSKILAKGNAIRWHSYGQAPSAVLIDPRLGFSTSTVSLGISMIPPGSHTGRHKHSEAIVYIVSGRGYSIVGGKKYSWREGDALYIPPETYHQHFNLDRKNHVRYLRILAEPLMVNLIPILAARAQLQRAERHPKFKM